MSEKAAEKTWPQRELGRELSNWGRWGDDDEIGTMNFVTQEKRVASMAAVRSGKTFDLGMPFDQNGPFQDASLLAHRINPRHLMVMNPWDSLSGDGSFFADDMIIMGLQSATQWDGLCHVGYDGYFYNNVPIKSFTTAAGATKNDFPKVNDRLVSRAVLLDIARLKGVDVLPDSYEITGADLLAAEKRQGVAVESGDILLLRTGAYRYFLDGDREHFLRNAPGPGLDTCRFLYDREVAAIAVDNYSGEVMPSPIPGAAVPWHQVILRDMGMTLGEMFNFEDLAADSEADGQWESLFCGTGVKVTGSVGSPVSPIAIK
jgi:kynurenine formamidase